jgi:hypothetical protein
MKTYGGVDVLFQILLTSALAGGERQLHTPAALHPGKQPPCTHLIGGWVGPRAGMDNVEKRKFLTPQGTQNSDPSVVQPAASRYTDYAIPALVA